MVITIAKNLLLDSVKIIKVNTVLIRSKKATIKL